MTRVKNFRIAIRPREVARWLKKERGLQITPELEASIDQAAQAIKWRLEPSALFTTVPLATLQKTTPLELPAKAMAASLIAVTLGAAVEEDRQTAMAHPDPMQEPLMAGLQEEALQQAVSFAYRLIQEQAKEEECELSIPVVIDDPALVGPVGSLLTASRIGLTLEAGASLPSYARMAWVSWTPLKKAKKADASLREKATV